MSHLSQQTNPSTPIGGRYKIIGELGSGGFGQTFLAQDLHLPGHPECAIKQLKPQANDDTTLEMARRLFETEAQVLYILGNHDQIPRLLAHFEETEEFYLAQEYIEGEPLTKELVVGQPWLESQVIALLQDILQVLAFVHQQNVIHRDLKPPNLLRRRSDGRIILIDFGAVKQVSAHLDLETGETNMTISIGTKGYMPNEQLAGNPRFSSDVYAVGRLGIQALTGVHPTRLSEDPQTGELEWRKHAPHVSSELADILDKMVRYDFRDRYSTAVEALDALQSLPDRWLESLPLSDAVGATPKQELSSSTATKELEQSIEAEEEQEPTNIWLKEAVILEETSMPVGIHDTTEPLSQQHNFPDRDSVAQPITTRGILKQWLVKFWPVLAILAAIGITAGVMESLQSWKNSRQLLNRDGVPNVSPTRTPIVKATPTPKPKPTELLSQAEQQRKVGQYEQALLLFDQAIDGKPSLNQSDMAKAYWGRCYSLNKLKQPAKAIVACNDAIDLNPDYAEAFWSKGQALDQQKEDLDALQLYEKATKLKPDFTEGWLSYGISLQGFGRSEEAIRALNKAIALKRDIADAWSTKGEALWNLGRYNEAIEALDKALEIQPNHAQALKLRQKVQRDIDKEREQ
jgi:serine/threonine protein kinase/Tfp pilus assembly protein PilF